jgi:signal transduction histidine kinase
MSAYAYALAAIALLIIVAGDGWAYTSAALFWVPLTAVAYLTFFSTVPSLALGSSLGSTITVAAAVLYPPSAVVLFTLVGAAHWRELRRETNVTMAVFNRAMFALCGGLASAVAGAVIAMTGSEAWRLLPAAVVASAAYDIGNTVLLAAMLVIRRGHRWRRALLEAANPFPRFAANAAASALLSLLVVVLVRDVGRWAILLMAVPVWLSQSAQRSAREAEDRAEQLAARVRELEMLNDLSRRLLSVHDAADVKVTADGALSGAVDGGGPAAAVVLADDAPGAPADRGHRVVPIPGADGARIEVAELDDASTAVVEAAAALIGLTLTRLQIEAELAENERARTALTARILEEATHERSRIAMAVHDDVLPLFAAAQMQIDSIDLMLDLEQPDKARAAAEQSLDGIGVGITALRETLEELRQATMTPGDLVPAVGRLLGDLQMRTGVRTTVAAPDPMPQLPFAVEVLAYETVRGGLANVERHAGATTVQVEISCGRGRLEVLMQDDGRGFDPTAIGKRSHGLALMRQRAELARGSFDITGRPGAGTTVRLEVPTW